MYSVVYIIESCLPYGISVLAAEMLTYFWRVGSRNSEYNMRTSDIDGGVCLPVGFSTKPHILCILATSFFFKWFQNIMNEWDKNLYGNEYILKCGQ